MTIQIWFDLTRFRKRLFGSHLEFVWAGYVGEVYGHGITLAWTLVGSLPGFFLATYVFNPIIYPLKLNSINEVSLSLKIPIIYPLKLNSVNKVSLLLKIPIMGAAT